MNELIINPIYYPLLENKNRYLILYGGAGSGKSYFAAQKILIRTIQEPGHRFLIIRKVAKTIRKSCYQLLIDIINQYNLNDYFHIIDSRMDIECLANGNEIMTAGVDDVEKLKSIQEPTGIWIEEATELHESEFRQIDLRLRSRTKNYEQIIFTFNPISVLHWLNKINLNDSYTLKTTYRNNKFVSNNYVKTLESLKEQDDNFYKIYALGEWGMLEDLIYKPFIKLDKFPMFEEIIYGLDFGYNNPTALVKIGIKDKEYFLEELIYQSKLLNTDIIDRMKLFGIKKEFIYCDSAEPGKIEEINRAGFKAKPSDKSVKDGIDFCKRQKIYTLGSNINLNKESLNYSYRKDKNGNVIDEPVKFNDHAMDAMRYAIYSHSKKARPGVRFI